MIRKLITLLAWCPLLAAADTIEVRTADVVGPFVLPAPYTVSPKNQRGDTFSASEYLAENRSLLTAEATGSVSRGDALTASAPTLRLLRFRVRTDRFTKASVAAKTLANYKVYADGAEATMPLRLKPGETRVELLVLTDSATKDTFNVSLTGDAIAHLQVNPDGKRLWTQADMLFGPHYANVSLSPGGRFLTYDITELRPDGSRQDRTLLKETATLKTLRTYDRHTDMRWLPRRDALYTVRTAANGTRRLLSIDPATGAETLLAEGVPEGRFTISPDETFLIADRDEKGSTDLSGTHRVIDPDDQMPGWRNRNALFLYDFRTSTLRRLTFGDRSVSLFDISPDSRRLLIGFQDMKPEQTPFERLTVVELDVASGRADTLLNAEPFVAQCAYSPDGSRLVVKASPWAFGKIGAEVGEGQVPNSFDYRLYLFDLATRRATPALPGFKPSVRRFTWAEGDGRIYFDADNGADVSLYRLDPRTLAVEQLPVPVSLVQGYDLSTLERRPRLAAFGQSGETARHLYVGEAGRTLRETGEIDFAREMADVALPTCHDWTFRASRGDTISGFYFLPADFDATRRYPLIVYYYGGCMPTTKNLEGFWPLSAYTAQGYVLLVVEPSGAIGFGQEFAARHVGTWGDESADDIIEGVRRFCHDHPFVNAQKIGCIGASYGGFMTQYLQTKTDLFAAAISHAGISDITGYWGGGYWGYTYGETAEYGQFPWSDPDLFVKHSPLYNAHKIHTPLLLLHGSHDTNVPTQQSQAMYTALRILGRPTAYVTFDGENHVITTFDKRMKWQEIINAWFALWLKDQPEWWRDLYPADTFSPTPEQQ